MQITNINNLPDAIVQAIKNDSYDRGDSDYTATELISPPRQLALKKRHKHEITEDAEDCLYRLYGKIAHKLLEDANDIDLAEKRFFMQIAGFKISAQIDTLAIHDGLLSDYKFTSSWSFMADKEAKDDWTAQMNIQDLLVSRNGYKVESLRIVGLLRDWKPRDAKRNPKFPQSPIQIMPIEKWGKDKTTEYIEERIRIHEASKTMTILPRCSAADRWAKPSLYAVMKGERAVKGGVKASMEEAKALLDQTPNARIEVRPGENIRCENYCSVSEFCSQFKMMKNNKPIERENSDERICNA